MSGYMLIADLGVCLCISREHLIVVNSRNEIN